MKKTAWFPAHIKPVHKGLYQVRAGVVSTYANWDGEHWCLMSPNPYEASKQKHASWRQDRIWRGIKKE